MVNWKNTPKTQSFFKNSTVIFCYVKGKRCVRGRSIILPIFFTKIPRWILYNSFISLLYVINIYIGSCINENEKTWDV